MDFQYWIYRNLPFMNFIMILNNRYKINESRLCFSDTDSLLLEIKTTDIYKDMEIDKEMYDFSSYSKYHFLFSNSNKKQLGKMKDEPMEEFCGIRSICYSILYKIYKMTAK